MTKRLENIPGMGEDSWVVIKKFSYGESCRIRSKALSFKVTQHKQEGEVDFLELQMRMLLYGIKQASFFKEGLTEDQKKQYLDEELSSETGSWLFDQINVYNTPSADAEKK